MVMSPMVRQPRTSLRGTGAGCAQPPLHFVYANPLTHARARSDRNALGKSCIRTTVVFALD